MFRLIGLAGPAHVGKTTIAGLCTGYMVKSFATPLKESLSAMTGLSMRYFTDFKLKEEAIPWISKSPRQLMQLMATEFVREMVCEDFWVRRMEKQIVRSPLPVVIDDVRFEDEAAMVRRFGGIVVHLRRDQAATTKYTDHASEQELKVFPEDTVYQLTTSQSVRDMYRILKIGWTNDEED